MFTTISVRFVKYESVTIKFLYLWNGGGAVLQKKYDRIMSEFDCREVLCEPIREMPRCRPGMVARRMYVDSMDFNDKSYYAVSQNRTVY